MKIRKTRSLILAVLTASSSIAAFSSCGKKAEPVKQRRTNVYSAEEIPLPEEARYVQSLSASGGKAYVFYSAGYYVTYDAEGNEVKRVKESEFTWEDDAPVLYANSVDEAYEEDGEPVEEPTGWTNYESVPMITTVDLASKQYSTVEADGGDILMNGNMNGRFQMGTDGRLYGVSTQWNWNEETQESSQSTSLITLDPKTGEMGIAAQFGDDLKTKAGMDPSEYFYINNCVIGSDVLYVQTEKDVLVLDLDGNYKTKLDLGITAADYWLNGMYSSGDRLMLSCYVDGKQKFMMVDGGKASEFTVQTGEDMTLSAMNPVAADDGHLYFNSSTGIYAYDTATGSFGELLNYINSDIDTSDMNEFVFLEDGRILTSSSSYGIVYDRAIVGKPAPDNPVLTLYTRVPDEQLAEEIILNVGMIYADYNLRRAMIRFNKQNTGVRLAIKDYSIYNNEENEWTGAITKFNNDIVTGSLPDIVLLNSEMPVESYFSKKVFVDLNKFIDDPEKGIDRSTLVTNILDANLTDGKLYSMIYSYNVSTLLAKSEIVGTKEGWTFEEMMAAIKKLPEGARAFFDYTRDNLVEVFFTNSMNSFIDWEAGKSYFDTPGFIEFAKYLKDCPEKGYWEELYGDNYEYDPDLQRQYEEGYQLRFARNMALFQMLSIYDASAYQNACNNFLTTEVTAIGYPRQGEGNGAVIVPNIELAISAKTAAQDEAWEAFKFFLGDEGLSENWGLTVNKAEFDARFANAKENYGDWGGYTEEDRQWMKEAGYSDEYINYMMKSRTPYDPALTEACRRIVTNASVVARTDSALVDIVKEDLSAVFSGQKTAEDVAKQIASRVDLYVAEHK